MAAFRLPFSFDPEALHAAIHQVLPEEWIGHYRNSEYEGEWALAALRSVAGHTAVIHAVPIGSIADFYKGTALLERCPYLQSVFSTFLCPMGAARFMLLGPGARILEHCDSMGEGEAQEIRLHIPIQTNEQVHFWVNHERIPMQVGELWYADFGLPHRVENNSQEARIHLVMDCLRNDWLRRILEIGQICHFLNQIGIDVNYTKLGDDTFLPGIEIQQGTLQIDVEKLKNPGDLLHEAGHIAVTTASERPLLGGNVGENDPNAMGQEIASILWSYAALNAIGLAPDVVFHPDGYKGASDWFISNFTNKTYMGLPLLQWMGMTDEAFPKMTRWLR